MYLYTLFIIYIYESTSSDCDCCMKQTTQSLHDQEQSKNVKNRHTRLGAALHAERDRTHETRLTGTDSAGKIIPGSIECIETTEYGS